MVFQCFWVFNQQFTVKCVVVPRVFAASQHHSRAAGSSRSAGTFLRYFSASFDVDIVFEVCVFDASGSSETKSQGGRNNDTKQQQQQQQQCGCGQK